MTTGNDLVVRTWRATATSARAREYHRYFAGTLLPQLRELPGFNGGYLLSRDMSRWSNPKRKRCCWTSTPPPPTAACSSTPGADRSPAVSGRYRGSRGGRL
jgi:hypothetical protein